MNDKNILIIGGSDGIGKACAEKFLHAGAAVFNASREPCELEGVKNITLDVSDTGAVKRAAEEALTASGNKIDILIYSPGFSMAAPFELTKDFDYRYLFEVNFFGFAEIAQLLLPRMRERKDGRIIAVSSIAAVYPLAFDAFYSASKAALNLLVRGMNEELSPYNVKVSSIMPGGTATEFTRERKVYSKELAGVYEAEMLKAAAKLAHTEQNGMAPEKVADAIFKLAENPAPPAVSAAGAANKAIAFALKLLN